MSRLTRLLLLLALGAALAASPALAQKLNINPVPPHVKPQWTPLPNNHKIFYAPNLPADVFRYRGKYYLFWAGTLFKSNKVSGPWTMELKVPTFFYEIDPSYFKTVKKEPAPAPTPVPMPQTTVPPAPEQVAPQEQAPQEQEQAPPPEPAMPPPSAPGSAPENPANEPNSNAPVPAPKVM